MECGPFVSAQQRGSRIEADILTAYATSIGGNMNKPSSSKFSLITGLVTQAVGGVIYFLAFMSSLSRTSIYSDTSGSTVGMVIGAIIGLAGWIFLVVGISRASAGIDYLVSVAAVPLSPVERREQESRLASSEE
jgi:hypothetical protein